MTALNFSTCAGAVVTNDYCDQNFTMFMRDVKREIEYPRPKGTKKSEDIGHKNYKFDADSLLS